MKTKFNDFINERLGINDVVIETGDLIDDEIQKQIKEHGTNKQIRFLLDNKKCKYPYDQMPIIIGIIPKMEEQGVSGLGHLEDLPNQIVGVIEIGNYEHKGTLYHEVNHLYQSIISYIKNPKNGYTDVSQGLFLKYFNLVRYSKTKKDLYKSLGKPFNELEVIIDTAYMVSESEMNARMLNVWNYLYKHNDDINSKDDFLKRLHKSKNFNSYYGLSKFPMIKKILSNSEMKRALIETLSILVEKDLKEKPNKKEIEKFIKKLDEETIKRSEKFIKKCYKLYDLLQTKKEQKVEDVLQN